MIDGNVLIGSWKYHNKIYSPEEILTRIDKYRVDKAFVASMRGVFEQDYLGNEETYKLAMENQKFIPVGTIMPTRMIDVEEEIILRKRQGFVAFRLFNEYQNMNLYSLAVEKILYLLEKYNMPLILNATNLNKSNCFSHTDKLFSKSEIPVLILEASGYNLAEIILLAQKHPNFIFGTRGFNLNEAIETFCKEVSSSQLAYTSGIPFRYENQSIYTINTAEISDNDKNIILHENLTKWMKGDI